MLASFALTIMYTQVTVATPGAETALDWTDDHVAQGFSWTPGYVSFGVPDHDGTCVIEVEDARRANVSPDALWAVRVPFAVGVEPLAIGTLFDERPVAVPSGRHGLVFQAFPGTEPDVAFVLRLTFGPAGRPAFAVLKTGDVLTTTAVLRPSPSAA